MTRTDIIYVGIFFEKEVLTGCLNRDIKHKHVTLAFRPIKKHLKELLPYVGQEVTVTVLSYGKDVANEGLLVSIPSDIPYHSFHQPHITLSVSEYGKPYETGNMLMDEPVPENIPKILTGKIGFWTKEKTVEFDVEKFPDLKDL